MIPPAEQGNNRRSIGNGIEVIDDASRLAIVLIQRRLETGGPISLVLPSTTTGTGEGVKVAHDELIVFEFANPFLVCAEVEWVSEIVVVKTHELREAERRISAT